MEKIEEKGMNIAIIELKDQFDDEKDMLDCFYTVSEEINKIKNKRHNIVLGLCLFIYCIITFSVLFYDVLSKLIPIVTIIIIIIILIGMLYWLIIEDIIIRNKAKIIYNNGYHICGFIETNKNRMLVDKCITKCEEIEPYIKQIREEVKL